MSIGSVTAWSERAALLAAAVIVKLAKSKEVSMARVDSLENKSIITAKVILI